MKVYHHQRLVDALENLLKEMSADGVRLPYDRVNLSHDMAKAAEAIYNAAEKGAARR